MKYKTLENVTRSQLENLTDEEAIQMVEEVRCEEQAEMCRRALLEILSKQEKTIVTPKVVQ
jgi:hypothetical protein